jgi:hypothetical protein
MISAIVNVSILKPAQLKANFSPFFNGEKVAAGG